MVLNPEIQAKAQAEIDEIIGKDRLPDFNDRPALPYIDAVLRETLRWQPVFPFGLFHCFPFFPSSDNMFRHPRRNNDQ